MEKGEHHSIACLVLYGLRVCELTGEGEWKGSYLYSDSPVRFPLIIWKSVKERSLPITKCLTNSKEEKNYVISGELIFPLFLLLTFLHSTFLPPSESAARWLQTPHLQPYHHSWFLTLWVSKAGPCSDN